MRLPLNIWVSDVKVSQKLLDGASRKIAANPTLVRKLYDGTYEINAELPTGYQPKLNIAASFLSARFDQNGQLFEISERDDCSSGGWMASCIPLQMYKIFLNAFLYPDSNYMQLDLF